MDEVSKPEKVKMVFVGGKKAPTGLRIGQVVLHPKRYLGYPWFEPLPEGKDAKIGDQVSLKDIPGAKHKVRVKMPERRPGNKALSEVEGKFRMRFRNNVSGVPIKNAPGNLKHGNIYELSLRHSNLPWFELLEEPGTIIVPSSGPHESVYDEEGIFVPPEAIDEDFDEIQTEDEPPGPYTPEELVAQMKKHQDVKEGNLDKDDFADADEEERETGLLKVETPEDLKEDEPEPEEQANLEEEAEKELILPTEAEIERMNKIGLVTFIKEHDGEANMRMGKDDLLIAALAIREGLDG